MKITELDHWKKASDFWLTPIENVKEALKSNLNIIDERFPEWKLKYDGNPSEYLNHDARREFFTTIRIVLQNQQLAYVYIRDHLTDEEWWQLKIGAVSLQTKNQAIREHALMVKFFNVHAIAMATESTLRAIVRSSEDNFNVTGMTGIEKIYDDILEKTGLQKLRPLFDIMRLVKNTIHNNGIVYIYGERDVEIEYKEKTFLFENGNALDWLQEEFLVWLPEQINEAMFEIITSSMISNISHCPRGS